MDDPVRSGDKYDRIEPDVDILSPNDKQPLILKRQSSDLIGYGLIFIVPNSWKTFAEDRKAR